MNAYPNPNDDGMVTIFEQDGKIYCAISHAVPARDSAKLVAQEIRGMVSIPRAKMRVVNVEDLKAMPFGKPKR